MRRFIPAIELLYLGVNDQLGAEPVRALEHGLGLWAMRFLLATLALSPLRQLAGVDLLRFRRQFGLLAFYYVVLHLAAYVAIDMGLDAKALWADILKRPYVTIGMLGFLLMIPLALTSNNIDDQADGRPCLGAASTALYFGRRRGPRISFWSSSPGRWSPSSMRQSPRFFWGIAPRGSGGLRVAASPEGRAVGGAENLPVREAHPYYCGESAPRCGARTAGQHSAPRKGAALSSSSFGGKEMPEGLVKLMMLGLLGFFFGAALAG